MPDVLHLRPGADLAAWLASRAERMTPPVSPHMQARTELEMWRSVLAAELRGLILPLGWARCIAGALAGPQMTPAVAAGSRMGRVYHEVFDAFRLARTGPGGDISSYGAKHAPEGDDPARFEQDLLDWLESLSPAADHALADAISRWWRFDLDGTAEGFAAAGLRVTP